MTADEISRFRAEMPAFDVAQTPATAMGQIAEEVRTTYGAVRSAHPQTSFAAIGLRAHQLMDGHEIDCHLGESSPLARMYEAEAQILLLGVGYEACTAFHLAEYRYEEHPPERTYRCVISVNGRATWWEYRDVCLDDEGIEAFGVYNDQNALVRYGRVGHASCRLMAFTETVDNAIGWLRERRSG